ncbi:MAG: serine/threonine protein phosphatase [Planctomycetales bacterium]|nr:serine/threonine protein phosphatase [Planctomycetales bacterium]
MRRFVIGDIHGCDKALRTLIECIDPQPDDELIFLGDYVDRGPDSRGVIDQIIELQSICRVVALRGNHEIMLYSVAFGGLTADMWLAAGGKATVTSYGGSLDKIPDTHRAFLQSLRPHYETAESIFVHACYEARTPMDQLNDELRYWTHLSVSPGPHFSGKKVYVGHTPQPSGIVMDLGYLVCVDTYCFGNGFLTAMNVETNEVIQVDKKGFRRRVPAEKLFQFVAATAKSLRSLFFRSGSVEDPNNRVSANAGSGDTQTDQ